MAQGGWLEPRLSPWLRRAEFYPATIVVPGGFDAYARVLHPVATPEHGGQLVRWGDVAAWSGRPLRPDAQFHSVALPAEDPGTPRPGGGEVPPEGSLWAADAAALAAIARQWTAAPDDCWFCVWNGFGWGAATAVLSAAGPGQDAVPAPAHPDPVPPAVRAGPLVRLPNREYFLYRGTAEDVVTLARVPGTGGQSPSLWWPADHAWCVATDIDTPWTYVGGSRGLIGALLAGSSLEALPASPGDPANRVEDWVTGWAAELADSLMDSGTAELVTPGGSVRATLRRRGLSAARDLEFTTTSRSGTERGGVQRALSSDAVKLRRELIRYLTFAVVELA